MSNVKVAVLELSKWGYKDQEGYVSLSQKLSEEDKAKIVPGAEFEAEYYVSPKGTRYLNKIIKTLSSPIVKMFNQGNLGSTKTTADPVVEQPKASVIVVDTQTSGIAPYADRSVDSARAKRFTPKFTKKDAVDNTMSKQEWADKDQRISRQGAIQAAVIALAPVVSLEELPQAAIGLARTMLQFVKGE